MVVYSNYPKDSRVRREAEGLVKAGMSVDVISLKGDGELLNAQINNVNIHRINIRKKRGSKLQYLWQWSFFLVAAFVKLSWLQIVKKYHIVHLHNMPDIIVFSAFLCKLIGAKLILDLHDPMPEIYKTKYNITGFHPIIRVLEFLEALSIRFVDLVITPNIAFRNLFISRGCPPNKIHIVMNSPQENIFQSEFQNRNRDDDQKQNEFIIMYHGYISEYNGLDIAIEAIVRVRKKIPKLVFHVYGSGNYLERVQEQINRLNLNDIVRVHGAVPIECIAQAIKSINVGIISNKMTPFTALNFPTRIFEYLIMGKPVIAPRTQGILDYFDEDSLFFFEPGNVDDLAKQIIKLNSKRSQCQKIVNKGVKVYHQYRWELQQKHFANLVAGVLGLDLKVIG
jgi:glycosyltransferase involved in cell wall biosynthesis